MKKKIIAMAAFVLVLAFAFAPAAFAAETFTVADFEKDANGFGGAMRQQSANNRNFGALENTDQRWVESFKELDKMQFEAAAFSFDARSANVKNLGVRFTDATGQVFQQRVSVKDDGQWQRVRITNFTLGQAWGGAGDKQFHHPAKSVGFILEQKGEIAVDGIAFELSGTRIIPDLDWEFPTLGHIFDRAADVAITLRSQSPRITWEITDFWRNTVASGEIELKNKEAVLRPDAVRAQGYYLLKLSREGKPDKYVSFAIVPPFSPKNRADSPFGVMTHFAQNMPLDILPLMGRIGITAIRDEHYWWQVEEEKGVYKFPPRSDNYMADAKAQDVDALVAMTFQNKHYDDNLTPHTPEGCDAYGDYGQAILKRYGSQIKWLEIWNEYNGTWCVGPAATDRPKYYAQMLKHAYQKIKAIRPDVQVLGCATVLIPMPYIEGIFKHGGLDYMDAVVLHPYRRNPEGVELEIDQVNDLMRQYNNGKTKPIWITETGTHNTREDAWEDGLKLYESGRRHVARYLARQYTLLLSRDVEKIFWYLCRDYDTFTSMGLVRNIDDPMGRYAVAPAYAAYATLIRELEGAKFVERADLGRYTYALKFDTAKGPVWVCWATQPATIGFAVDAPREVVDIMGATSTLRPIDGQVTLSLNEDILFFRGNAKPTATPKLAIVPELRCPVGGIPRFNAGKNATGYLLSINNAAPVALDANGSAPLPMIDTSMPNVTDFRYRIEKNSSNLGRPAAIGTIRHEVVEPLAFAPDSIRAITPATLIASLENRLPDAPAYELRGIDWKLGAASKTSVGERSEPAWRPAIATRKRAPLPATARLDASLSDLDAPLAPYTTQPLELTAKFANRSDFVWRGAAAYNPCVKFAGGADGWNAIPALDLIVSGQKWGATSIKKAAAKLAYTPDALRIRIATDAAPADAAIRIGVATADTRVWHILRIADNKLVSDLARGAASLQTQPIQFRDGACEIVLPWTTLGLPAPAAASTFRLALSIGNDKGWHEWGGGLALGLTPDRHALCVFTDPAAKIPAAPDFATIPAAVKTAAATQLGRVLTDSESDYSKEQGGNRNYYGYYAGRGAGTGNNTAPTGPYTDDDFIQMHHVETIWGYNWGPKEDGYPHMNLSAGGGHPGARDGLPIWVVRRWKSDYTGRASITALLRSNEHKSDGVGMRVLINGIQVAELLVEGGQQLPLDINVDIKANDLVDFAFTPGAEATLHYDAFTYSFRIRELGGL